MKKLIVFSLCAILFATSCKEEAPVASFTVDKTKAYIDETVVFTNQSTDAESLIWDFGDNEISNEQNPTHAYKTGGPKTISLTASNGGGNHVFVSKVNVHDGISSYQVKNNTSIDILMTSYFWDGDDIQNFINHGKMKTNEISDTLYTSRNAINLGGEMYGKTFIAVNNYPIIKNAHNLLIIDGETQVYMPKSGQKSGNVKFNILNDKINE